MGLDLTLLPFDGDMHGMAFSHTVLDCDRDNVFQSILDEPQKMKVPDNFRSFLSRDEKYEESHYGTTIDTPYGEPLLFVEVESLLRYKDAIDQRGKNKAVWAYLAALPPRTKVALYWH